MTNIPAQSRQEEAKFISLIKAGEDLGVSRSTVHYYLGQLGIKVHKFPLDRKAYISLEDLGRIKAAKRASEPGLR